MKDESEKKRDEVLARMLNTPPESNKDFVDRKNAKGDKPLKDSDNKKTPV